LIGVFAPRLPPIFAEVLRQLGRERAWVVHGLAADSGGMDNISTCGATTIAELQGGEITSAVLDVNWLGIPRAAVVELQGGNARENAATLEGILAGKITGPRRDIAVANAAGGFVVAGLARDLNEGIALAGQQIDTGRALAKLHALRNYEPKVSR
jgi:anthranilate phosphoribosyltransferase